MPILKAETSEYPVNLLEAAPNDDADRRWWAVYTKSRQEKAFARQLEGMSIPFYLPLVSQTKATAGRRTTSLLPLFQSYVFLFANEHERVQALATQRSTGMHSAPNTEAMTRDLLSIRNLISVGAPLTIESQLQPGRRVRVKSGALMGLEGTVIARRGGDRLLVGVQFLQQGVSIEIGDFQVEPL